MVNEKSFPYYQISMKLILSILFPILSFSQDFVSYLKENAITFSSIEQLNDSAYQKFKPFDAIMIGEMHGTQEPALLVEYLAQLIINKEGSISVGIELPQLEVAQFIKHSKKKNLLQSQFFLKENTDGRNSQAWFDLILACSQNKSIHLFFFDNSHEYQIENRDSSMYVDVLKQKLRYPEEKIITLSGNIHNQLIPFNEQETMASYCAADTSSFQRICSVRHLFSEGTMMNNTGNGLELHTIDYEASIYSTTVDSDNYILFYETSEPSANNCLFYTKKVNLSSLLKN